MQMKAEGVYFSPKKFFTPLKSFLPPLTIFLPPFDGYINQILLTYV